jgi:glutathione S-transferase
MADVPIACEIHRWSGLPVEHRERPHLARWYAGIRNMRAAAGALDIPLS